MSEKRPKSKKGSRSNSRVGSSKESRKGLDTDKYCGQQIQIPPQLPNILKQYTKGAIRTQPRDLLVWTAAYFRAMSNGEMPPVKDRLEYPNAEQPEGLTIGLLRVLNAQFVAGKKEKVSQREIKTKWMGICQREEKIDEMYRIGRMNSTKDCEWKKILALMAGTLGKNLTDTMRVLCETMTEEPEGSEPLVRWDAWWELYSFLAKVDGTISADQVQEVMRYLKPISAANFNMIGPRDFTNQDCPELY